VDRGEVGRVGVDVSGRRGGQIERGGISGKFATQFRN